MPSLPNSMPINIKRIRAGIPNFTENFSAITQSRITADTSRSVSVIAFLLLAVNFFVTKDSFAEILIKYNTKKSDCKNINASQAA